MSWRMKMRSAFSQQWGEDNDMCAKPCSVTFPAVGGGPSLEGILHCPDGSAPFPAAVVCHPHPLMGGRMDNAVVVTVCRTLAEQGWVALRFNFRGAGGSAGAFDGGRGEMNDVAGAVDFLCAQTETAQQVGIVGYSFGAEVGLHYAAEKDDPRISWLAGVALIQKFYTDPFLDADRRPKLFIAGDQDEWASADALREYVARLKPPKRLCIIPGADHIFAGCELEVAELIADFLLALQKGDD